MQCQQISISTEEEVCVAAEGEFQKLVVAFVAAVAYKTIDPDWLQCRLEGIEGLLPGGKSTAPLKLGALQHFRKLDENGS
jgi:hypothetical protein